MGKIKRQRRKLHASAAKGKGTDNVDDAVEMDSGLLQPSNLFPIKGLFGDPSSTDQLRSQNRGDEDEDDRMSFISKKSIKVRGETQQMSKMEKRKLRHERWLEKMDSINTAKRKEKDAKKRANVAVVGDLHPLQDALPELSEILRIGPQYASKNTRNSRPEKKARSTLKMKDRQKLMLEETARFQEVLKHSAFKSNPFATINEHLKNKLKQEQELEQT